MRYVELLNSDFTTFELLEATLKWEVSQSVAFKKGFKKYKDDKIIVAALAKLLAFIQTADKVPPATAYPPEFRVHFVKFPKYHQKGLWAHLKGSRFGLLFDVELGKIKLIAIGTHDDVGIGSF